MQYFEIDGWKESAQPLSRLPEGAQPISFGLEYEVESTAFYRSDKVNAIPITSLDQYIRACNAITPCISHNIWYRGQLSTWNITASIFRSPVLVEREDSLIETILTNYPEDFESCHSFFSKLVKLKHYSCPSRLLDVTGNPLVALFFALQEVDRANPFGVVYTCFSKRTKEYFERNPLVATYTAISRTNNNKCHECQVYRDHGSQRVPSLCHLQPELNPEVGCRLLRSLVFNALALNDEFEPKDSLTLDDFNGCIFVNPPMNNQRIVQQRGAFLIIGRNAEHPLMQSDQSVQAYFQVPTDYAPTAPSGAIVQSMYGRQYTFVVPYSAKEALLRGLDDLGINDAFVFPEIERRINYYKEKLGSNHDATL